jgi:hypothetical protein
MPWLKSKVRYDENPINPAKSAASAPGSAPYAGAAAPRESPRAIRCGRTCGGARTASLAARGAARVARSMRGCACGDRGGVELSAGLKLGNRSGRGASPGLLKAALRNRARFWNLPLALARGAFGGKVRQQGGQARRELFACRAPWTACRHPGRAPLKASRWPKTAASPSTLYN